MKVVKREVIKIEALEVSKVSTTIVEIAKRIRKSVLLKFSIYKHRECQHQWYGINVKSKIMTNAQDKFSICNDT